MDHAVIRNIDDFSIILEKHHVSIHKKLNNKNIHAS
jgi:hypothetical protein